MLRRSGAVAQPVVTAGLENTYGSYKYGTISEDPHDDKYKAGADPDAPLIGLSAMRSHGFDVARWGTDNLKPYYLLKLLAESNISPQLIATSIDFALGDRWYLYREILEPTDRGNVRVRIEPIENTEIEDWLERTDVMKILRARATDHYIYGNAFAQFVLSRDAKDIAFLNHIDASQARVEVIKNRESEHVYQCPDWTRPSYAPNTPEEGNVRRYKMFNPKKPLQYFRSVMHSKHYWPGQTYYGVRPWHSASNWILFANKIPVWMRTNIENGYTIRFHVEYPSDYFDYITTEKPEEIQAEKDRVFDEFDAWLAGEKNAGKTFFSPVKFDPMTGKKGEGWNIIPIKPEILDEAFVKAYTQTNNAMTSSFGIDPSLASIQQEGKFNSGSEKRIAAQLHQILRTPEARQIILEPFNEVIAKVNGWGRGVKIGLLNRNITTLDQDHSGLSQEMQ